MTLTVASAKRSSVPGGGENEDEPLVLAVRPAGLPSWASPLAPAEEEPPQRRHLSVSWMKSDPPAAAAPPATARLEVVLEARHTALLEPAGAI